jgi:hypothetical protein
VVSHEALYLRGYRRSLERQLVGIGEVIGIGPEKRTLLPRKRRLGRHDPPCCVRHPHPGIQHHFGFAAERSADCIEDCTEQKGPRLLELPPEVRFLPDPFQPREVEHDASVEQVPAGSHGIDSVQDDRPLCVEDALVGVCEESACREPTPGCKPAKAIAEPVGNPAEVVQRDNPGVVRSDRKIPRLPRLRPQWGLVGIKQAS